MSTNPYGPNEPASIVLAEEAWLQGALLSGIAYGALLVLFGQCFFMLLKQTKRTNYVAQAPFLAIVFLLFMFGTFFMGSNMKFTQLAFIENRNFPGGPSAFENDMFAIPSDALGNVSFVLSNWLCDSLIIWRYMIIYRGCRIPFWLIMAWPILIFLGSFTMGVLWLLQVSAASPFVNTTLNWTIPYFSLSLALNILVTIAIVLRLLVFRRRIASVLGSSHGSQYTSVAAMVVESASLFSLFSLLFLVPFALNSSIAEIFLQAMGQVQACATLLIVFRVASGKGWSARTQQSLMSTDGTGRNPKRGIHLSAMSPARMTSAGSGTQVATPMGRSLSKIDTSTLLPIAQVSVKKDVQSDADVVAEQGVMQMNTNTSDEFGSENNA